MGPEHAWWGGMWVFPIVMPVVMLLVMLVIVYLVFGSGRAHLPWHDSYQDRPRRDPDDALEIVRKRYARGELTREEFEQMKNDLT